MDAERLQVSFIRERAEVPERAAGAQPGRGPDEVPGDEIDAPARRVPGEGHAQAEPAADRPLLAARGDGPDVDEEDVPVELAARRPAEAPGDIDIALRFEGVEGIGLVLAVEDGEAGRAQGRDGGQGQEGGRAVQAAGEKRPGRGEGGEAGAPGRKRGESELGRGRDAERESGGQEGERGRARPQKAKAGPPWMRALWPSRASKTRWQRIRIPRGMALSSGLKTGLWRGVAGWPGPRTPRKK